MIKNKRNESEHEEFTVNTFIEYLQNAYTEDEKDLPLLISPDKIHCCRVVEISTGKTDPQDFAILDIMLETKHLITAHDVNIN